MIEVFLYLKAKLYSVSTKCKIIALLLVLLTAILAIIFIKNNLTSRKESTITNIYSKTTEDTIDSAEERGAIYGLDIKNKYEEVKGTDFAILVTTTDFLNGNIKTIKNDDYTKYIIENSDTNTIVEIKDANGKYRNAAFINYNRILKDTVITKDPIGGYIAPYGFTSNSKDKFNEYSEKTSSLKIYDDAEFSSKPIYDNNYDEIGILYIETIKSKQNH